MNKDAIYKLSYGMYVLTAASGKKDNGCIINTAGQVTDVPNRICAAVNKSNYTQELIQKSGVFNISVISEKAGFELYKRFGFCSGRDTDKFDGFSGCSRSKNGVCYITEGTNAYISAQVEQTVDLDTHMLYIAAVKDSAVLNDDPPATYSYYRSSVKPKPEKPDTAGKTVWRCVICGYIYEGEELPEDYICPLCKHPASDFEKITADTN